MVLVMPQLTDLTLSVSSAWSNTDSLYLYCEHDGASYKVKADDLTSLLGRETGCGIGTDIPVGFATGTTHRISFNSVYYENGAGWQDLGTSDDRLIAPFNGIAQLHASVLWVSQDNDVEHKMLLNDTFANTPIPGIRGGQPADGARQFSSHPIVVTSGDFFTLTARPYTAAGTLSEAYFSIYPLRFF
jgi:hypothetical protein